VPAVIASAWAVFLMQAQISPCCVATERLDAELARAHENGTSVSFVIADIDNFKAVNDGYGHQTGDQIIRAVAQALAGTVRELDLAARYGGEEFAVVLPGSRLGDARRSAERMRRAVSQSEVPGSISSVSPSSTGRPGWYPKLTSAKRT